MKTIIREQERRPSTRRRTRSEVDGKAVETPDDDPLPVIGSRGSSG